MAIQKHHIEQFGFWRIGGEDPAAWKSLEWPLGLLAELSTSTASTVWRFF